MEALLEIKAILDQFWHLKLFTVQDVQLTLGNVLLAGTLLLLTNRLARILSKLILKKVVEPFHPDSQALNTYRRMIYTANFVLFFVISLSIAGIPLTVFTVVGGALAIGIGFGSQNIVNNFISGLILMAERPLKVGDVVEVDSITGTVLEIGTRATRIRTQENKIWIVPNSMFLEKAVLNWSNRTAVVRAEVDVGVAYGSDLEKVRNLALKVLQEMPFVEKSPQARVIFNEFGDNSLMFKLLFWADVDKVDSLMQCRSDIRFALEKVYREAQVEISYPQRDLHLRSSTPLEVRIQH
ncbi:MAG: mechanosensitive ion channel family protein [Bacteriovoracia bacterium]